MSCILFFDGACRGNPGPMGIGAVLMQNGNKVKEISKRLGKGTNNIAEWMALIEGMKMAKAHGCRELEVRGDSQLIIKQITGHYRVKSENLIPLYDEAKRLSSGFGKISFKWVKRDNNAETDFLSNRAFE